MPAKPVMTKGSGIRSWSAWVDRELGRDTMKRVASTLPPELRNIPAQALPSGWYPVEVLGGCWTALAEREVKGDAKALDRFFREMGRFIAEDNLTTIYRFLLSVMSPDRVLGMTPRLWTTYFDNIVVDVSSEGQRKGRVVVGNLAVPYLGPVAQGWLELAYEKTGAKTFSVVERGWAQGKLANDPMVFDHRWSV